MNCNRYILFLLLVISISSYSQGFKGGISAGLNSARIDNDRHEIWGKMGLNVGTFVERDILPDVFGWVGEIKYTARGKYQGPTLTNPGIDKIDLKYLELPIGLYYRLNPEFSFQLGLSPDVLLSQRYFDENGLLDNPDPIYGSPSEDGDQLFYFGITGFAGANYFFHEKIAVGLRFNYSLIPFYKFDGYTDWYWNSGFFHDVLSINLRYYLVK
ncbi:MAG TPA: outer membrane beta-barrel protein [Bacteroidales bacterium]|nr:outer membrane beta-barrel protein [Bacteroidales bacterium]